MENNTKRYWKGLEEYSNDITFVKNADREFPEAPSQNTNYKSLVEGIGSDRRDFLKVLGFGMAAVSVAACTPAPERKAVPYLNKPVDTFPTIADWYASTYQEGGEYVSILVKTREGRPIKIEGNKLSGISKGGVSARVHASLLGLYDSEKLKNARKGENDIAWDALDKEVSAKLSSVAASGGQIRIVSNTILSPSTKAVIADFIAKYPTAQHIQYDANSVAGLVKANADSFGKAIVPSYDFSKAKVIVGLSCDFLGTWVAPTEFSRQYAQGRKLSSAKGGKRDMSRHYQFETILSTTGSNADYRAAVKPSQEGAVASALYRKLTGGSAASLGADVDKCLDKAAKDLKAAQGAALVVSGSNDPNVQTVVNAINSVLGSYGTTIDMGSAVNYRQGSDAAMNTLVDDAKAGRVGAVIFYGANPVYDHPRGAELKDAIAKASLSVSFAARADETTSLCQYIAPAPHFLESWDDAEPRSGQYSLTQPTISLLFDTRQAQSSLLKWSGSTTTYYDYLRGYWKRNILTGGNFESAWIQTLHDGVAGSAGSVSGASYGGNTEAAISAVSAAKGGALELALYEKVSIGTGAAANNPWLQELPDPVTKACWDNYACISQKTAKELGLEQFDVVKIDAKGKSVELPILIQPGQANGTVAIAIGYGREKSGKSGDGVGVNVYPMATSKNGFVSFNAGDVTLTKTGENRTIAQTQTHETVMGRDAVVQESRLAAYQKKQDAGRYKPTVHTSGGVKPVTEITLWNGYEKPNHSWGMAIDLNSCTGCGACVVSCNVENNVAVVGRQEVINRREMHWIRIDRYYSTDADLEDKSISGFKKMEIASENPEVVFQPLMCQHCGNAPCETVCPVLATTHSSEGLNQMAYNRCVGTRYCANNCPYKVRRFNWFKYFDETNVLGREFDNHFANDLGKMVINPDVTVRSRGVIEKCSMCVQRIQEGKLTAKKERRRPVDGEIITACAQSCPTEAIVFGDMNDPNSAISKLLADEKEGRAFTMLEEINVKPQVSYLTKIRNKDVEASAVAKAEEKHEEHAH